MQINQTISLRWLYLLIRFHESINLNVKLVFAISLLLLLLPDAIASKHDLETPIKPQVKIRKPFFLIINPLISKQDLALFEGQ